MKQPFVTNAAIDCIEPKAAGLKSSHSLLQERIALTDPRVALQSGNESGHSL